MGEITLEIVTWAMHRRRAKYRMSIGPLDGFLMQLYTMIPPTELGVDAPSVHVRGLGRVRAALGAA